MKQITVIFVIFFASFAGTLAFQKISTTFGTTTLTVVEFDLFRGEIRISPNMDFANVKVMFTDLPNQSISVKELRDLVKSKPIMK